MLAFHHTVRELWWGIGDENAFRVWRCGAGRGDHAFHGAVCVSRAGVGTTRRRGSSSSSRRPRWARRRRAGRSAWRAWRAANTRRRAQARRPSSGPAPGGPLHHEELLQGQGALERSEVLPLQHLPQHHGNVGGSADGRQASVDRRLGRLFPRLRGREHQESVCLQDGQGALRGVDGRRRQTRRPDRPHACHAAGMGRVLRAEQPGRRDAVAVGHQLSRAPCCRC